MDKRGFSRQGLFLWVFDREINFCRRRAWQSGKEKGRRQEGRGEQMGDGFAVPAPGNGFSKYSG